MVFKLKDDIQPANDALKVLLAVRSLSKKQRELIEDELDNLQSGQRGEKEAACRFNSARFQKRTLCRSCQVGGGETRNRCPNRPSCRLSPPA